MVRRIQKQLVIIFFLVASVSNGLDQSDILVEYSFDDQNIETGPDTFIVFEKGSKGCVDLNDSFRFSGYSSVELRDGQGDKDFPELLGYFPKRNSGKLYIHFAFLTTDQDDILNIALAGPKFFNLTRDGIGFWLKTKNGYLYHVSDSIPKKLFPIVSFRWYLVDVVYDIDKGTYDLEIIEENRTSPVIYLENQKNASNNPGSVVNLFSFVTDPFTDKSNLTYYVDDVIIGIDKEILKIPFVAPGRKRFFIDMWDEMQVKLRENSRCLPATSPYDFGIDDDDIHQLRQNGLLDYISEVANGKQFPREKAQHISSEYLEKLDGIFEWSLGCKVLSMDKPEEALAHFTSSQSKLRTAPIVGLSKILTLARLERWREVEDVISTIYYDWQNDERFAIAQAVIGVSRNDLNKAETWLGIPAEKIIKDYGNDVVNSSVKRIWGGEIDRDVVNILKIYMPDDWDEFYKQALVSEQYYYVLLWQGREKDAADYAERMIQRLEFLDAPTSIWIERRGDAAFFMRDYYTARNYYERNLRTNKTSRRLLEKLSDAYFLTGDYDRERQYREKVYGSLLDRKCG